MTDIASISGVQQLWEQTLGDPRVCVAVLDGPVELAHPCFKGAALDRLDNYLSHAGQVDPSYVTHATHIASILFGQHSGDVRGIAPRCRGLSLPVAIDEASTMCPLRLSRAIDAAHRAGANVIHVSTCIPTKSAQADDMVTSAVQSCLNDNIAVIAPVGNDHGECWCTPAVIPGVLAVGAMTEAGRPFPFSNWGKLYDQQGIIAVGEKILGAEAGGAVGRHNGTSCAAPIVTGAVALLMSLQLRERGAINASEVRRAILDSAQPCAQSMRCLVGKLDIAGARERLFRPSQVRHAERPYGANRDWGDVERWIDNELLLRTRSAK